MAERGAPILVAACGTPRNPWMKGDALGPLVAARLRQRRAEKRPELREWVDRVEIVDLGMRPAGLLDVLPGHQALAVVDALMGGGLTPGQVVEMDWFDPGRPGRGVLPQGKAPQPGRPRGAKKKPADIGL